MATDHPAAARDPKILRGRWYRHRRDGACQPLVLQLTAERASAGPVPQAAVREFPPAADQAAIQLLPEIIEVRSLSDADRDLPANAVQVSHPVRPGLSAVEKADDLAIGWEGGWIPQGRPNCADHIRCRSAGSASTAYPRMAPAYAVCFCEKTPVKTGRFPRLTRHSLHRAGLSHDNRQASLHQPR